jgi:hypothetical protein
LNAPGHRDQPLPAGPTVKLLVRLLTLSAGVLLVSGALRPWAFVPLGGLRFPLYGALGWGGLAGVAGLMLLLHPRPSPALLLAIAAGAAYLGHVIPLQMIARARATTGTIDTWFDPLNRLLDQFHIEGFHLSEWGLSAARAVGPGAALTLWGAGLSAAAALLTLFTLLVDPSRRSRPHTCPTCAARLSRRRQPHFCPACGAALVPVPVCVACHTPAEPDDRYCIRCGAQLAS